MSFIKYWGIQITVNKSIHSLNLQQVRDEMWIGPHVRLTGHLGAAYIIDEKLAKQYLKACVPVFEKRYKHGFEARIVECEESTNKRLLSRLDKDSEIIRTRLKTGNMVSNKKPDIHEISDSHRK